jgi:hypothetical protein
LEQAGEIKDRKDAFVVGCSNHLPGLVQGRLKD